MAFQVFRLKLRKSETTKLISIYQSSSSALLLWKAKPNHSAPPHHLEELICYQYHCLFPRFLVHFVSLHL